MITAFLSVSAGQVAASAALRCRSAPIVQNDAPWPRRLMRPTRLGHVLVVVIGFYGGAAARVPACHPLLLPTPAHIFMSPGMSRSIWERKICSAPLGIRRAATPRIRLADLEGRTHGRFAGPAFLCPIFVSSSPVFFPGVRSFFALFSFSRCARLPRSLFLAHPRLLPPILVSYRCRRRFTARAHRCADVRLEISRGRGGRVITGPRQRCARLTS